MAYEQRQRTVQVPTRWDNGESSGTGTSNQVQKYWYNTDTGQEFSQQQYDDYLASQQFAEEQKKSGLNADGSPIRPDFASIVDPKTGQLLPQYQLTAQPDITVDQTAINAIRDRALSKGPSAWAKMMTERQALEEAKARDDVRQASMTQAAQGYADLGMRGGVSSGARERLASGNSRNAMLKAQEVGRQGLLDRMNIGLQDETQRLDLLKTIPGYDFQNANIAAQNRDYRTKVDQTNLASYMQNNTNLNNYNMEGYKAGMEKWAAGKQADAQRSASGGGKK